MRIETCTVPYGFLTPSPRKTPALRPFLAPSPAGSVAFSPSPLSFDPEGFLELGFGAGVPLSFAARSTGAGAATGAAGGCTLSRTPTMRAAPVRVPIAAAVLRRIANSFGGSELEGVE